MSIEETPKISDPIFGPMEFRIQLTFEDRTWTARCLDTGATATGRSQKEALDSITGLIQKAIESAMLKAVRKDFPT